MNPMNVVYEGGQYELVVGNEGSVALADSENVVQTLAESMQGGLDEVVANSEFIFAGGADQQMITTLFSDADQLLLEGDTIFEVAEGTLLDAIVEAGLALAAALG